MTGVICSPGSVASRRGGGRCAFRLSGGVSRHFIATGRLLLISALLVAWVYGNSLAVNPETFGSNAGAVANVVDVSAPTCGPGPAQLRQLVLMAQAVPQAAALPCVRRAFGPGRRSVQG